MKEIVGTLATVLCFALLIWVLQLFIEPQQAQAEAEPVIRTIGQLWHSLQNAVK